MTINAYEAPYTPLFDHICGQAKVYSADVLAQAGVPSGVGDLRGLTPRQKALAWVQLIELAGPAAVSVETGRTLVTEAFTPHLLAVSRCATVGSAIRRLTAFRSPLTEAALTIEDGDRLTLTIDHPPEGVDYPSALYSVELGFLLDLVRLCCGAQITPAAVSFPAHLPQDGNLQDDFGCPILPGAGPRLHLKTEDADRPILAENADIGRFFPDHLRPDGSEDSSVVANTRAALFDLLPAGTAAAEDVCHRLTTTKRTLQRKLAFEETTFNDVLTGIRRDLAQHYLRQPALRTAEIAALLAFRDPNSFYRAFHSWTGMTPQQARALGGSTPPA